MTTTFIKPPAKKVKPLNEVKLRKATKKQVSTLIEMFSEKKMRPAGMSDADFDIFQKNESRGLKGKFSTVPGFSLKTGWKL